MNHSIPGKSIWLCLLSCVLFVCAVFLVVGCDKGNKDDGRSDALINEDIVKEDIFHDQGDIYLSDFEPTDSESVTVRLRLRRGNAVSVAVEWTTDLSASGETAEWQRVEMDFEKADVNDYYDYFIGTIPAQKSAYRYHFVVRNNKQTVYYAGRDAEVAQKNANGEYQNPFNGFSKDFLLQVNFSTPDWSKGALWYSAMPDSFYNGDPTNDKYGGAISGTPWGAVHSGGLGYFGGDFQGLYEKIDYFKELNCTALFINPVWLANHNAGYGFFDGTLIDSTFGNEQMLKKLSSSLHENNLRLMFDGVFNYFVGNSKYVNSSSLWPTEGKAASDKNSDYYNVFMRDGSGNLITNQFGYVVDFASEDAQKLIYSSPDSIMQYYVTACGVDGWRLDSAILFVASDGRSGTQIIQDMRKYMKEVAPDSLLCLENANEAGMYTDYAADTYWNQRFLKAIEAFMDGKVNKSTINLLSSNLYEAVLGLPRAVAHSSYNMLTNHDMDRILYLMDGDVAKAQSLYLMVMTYMGSPTIFYGEETGTLDADRFFVGMNWDRSTWNYDIFNQIKALGQFRAENEGLFKYGTLRSFGVDENNLLMKYQRSYQGMNILVLLNPAGKVRSGVEVDVHSLEVKNGEKLYDVLSGNSYVVQDGKVKIEIMPYGALLSNKKSQNWAGKWQLSGGEGEVKQIGENSFQVSGNRSAALSIYGNAILSLQSEGKITAFMRADNESGGAYYGAEIEGTKVTVKARESKGGTEKTVATLTVAKGETLSVVRSDDNTFYVETSNGKQASSECYVEMSYEGQCGFYGEGTVRNVTAKTAESQKSTQFEKGSDSMMFTAGETAKAVIADGKLTLKSAESGVYRLTHAPMRDITVKTQMSGSPKKDGDYMGVTVWQSENNFIFAGRAYVSGSVKLVVGQSINGQATIFASIDDVEGELVIQLERLGTYWTARYKTPEETDFNLLAEGLYCNFSDMNAGIVNYGSSEAVFEYFCFGNAVEDGQSVSAHASYGDCNQTSSQSASYSLVQYKIEGGSWQMVNGGFLQNDETAEVTALKNNQGNFKGFRADYSVRIHKGDGNVALRFGADHALRLFPSGKVELLKGSAVLRTLQAGTLPDEPVRIMAIMTDRGILSVYFGTEMKLLLSERVEGYTSGPIFIEGIRVAYEIASMQFQAYTVAHDTAAVTEFVATLDIKSIQQTNILNKAEIGFVFGGSVGCGKNGAFFVGINSKQEAFVEYGGEKLASVDLGSSFKSNVFLTLVVSGGKILLFADHYTGGDSDTFANQPVLEYESDFAHGGLVSLFSANGKFEYRNFKVYGLRLGENYKDTAVFTDRTFS